ncbi:hypothetical protein K505DRAFT_99080, partial [Melanomma pulvis-pyrius CBS 109.77]
MAQHNVFGTLATAGGGSVHAANIYNTDGGAVTFTTPATDSDSDSDTRCLRAWRLTDPRDDRTRILANKDPLLAGSCDWILHDAAFAQWWEDDESRILWIHGDPGKGKTMMMMALTEEIARRVGNTPDRKAATAFFFCQNTVPELSNAAAIVRGLTFLLATEQPALRRHLAKEYAEAGERLFEGFNVLPSLWRTLASMAQDASVSRLYLLVDALDECEQDLLRTFLHLATSPTASCKIKWVFTSRNIQSIQEQLLHVNFSHHTSLEVNSSRVSEAVVSFIRSKVDLLAKQKSYSEALKQQVRRDMEARADGTFLWAALVCKELERVMVHKTLEVMEQMPTGLSRLYERMLKRITVENDGEGRDLCEALLRAITIAQRPLHQAEMGYVAGLPPNIIDDSQTIEELVRSCGSFLTTREGIIFFVHQSAKDYFTTGSGCAIFPYGQPQAHEKLARRLLGSMSQTLTTDVCGVRWPGTQVQEADDEVVRERLPLHVQYACCHWTDHVKAGEMTLEDGGVVHEFLQARLLMLFEALGWLGRVSDGMGAMRQLADMTETGRNLQILLRDAIRFVRYSRTAIEQAPLQIYSSALIFAPKKSTVRQIFSQAIPRWMRQLPGVEQDWGACLQTLEGHAGDVESVAFSPDGHTVASGSEDKTVKL